MRQIYYTHIVRENTFLFNVSVSAAAQYMICSPSKVFEFCEREGPLLRHGDWGKWKARFHEAQANTLIDASGKNYARLAVAAMNEVEMRWNRRQRLRWIDLAKHEESQRGNAREYSGPMMKRSQARRSSI